MPGLCLDATLSLERQVLCFKLEPRFLLGERSLHGGSFEQERVSLCRFGILIRMLILID